MALQVLKRLFQQLLSRSFKARFNHNLARPWPHGRRGRTRQAAHYSIEQLEQRQLLSATTVDETSLPAPNPPVGDVTPSLISHHLLPGQQATDTVTLNFDQGPGPGPALPDPTADIVFVVDESGSMGGEHAWLSDVAHDLQNSLELAGITDNRFALVGYLDDGSVFSNAPADIKVSIYHEDGTYIDDAIITNEHEDDGAANSGYVRAEFNLPSDGSYYAVVETAVLDSQALISIDAENYHASATGTSGADWQTADNLSSSGEQHVQASAGNGTIYTSSTLSNAPRLDYNIDFSEAGDYYVWLRGAEDSSDDSVYVGLDGQLLAENDFRSQLTWRRTNDLSLKKITVSSPGQKTLNLWMGREGVQIDKIVLTKDPAFTPSGMGPSESTRDTLTDAFRQNTSSLQYSFALEDNSSAVTSEPLTLNTLISQSLSSQTAPHSYTFTLSGATELLFESVIGTSNHGWTLTDSSGDEVTRSEFDDEDQILSLGADTYTLTIAAGNAARTHYAFRMVDLTGAAAVVAGTQINSTLTPATGSQAYFLSATAGDRLYFDSQSWSGPSEARWRLVDSSGTILFDQSLAQNQDIVTAPQTGTYWLIVDGAPFDSAASQNFSFTVGNLGSSASSTSVATINTTSSLFDNTGTIASAGGQQHFTFSLTQESLLYLDSLTDTSDLTWSLSGPNGILIDGLALKNGDQVLKLAVGSYELTIDGSGDSTGSFAFRLNNLSDVATAITPGTPFGGTLSPAGESHVYALAATAGDRFSFDSQTWTGSADARWKLIDASGHQLFDDTLSTDQATHLLHDSNDYYLIVEGATTDSGSPQYSLNAVSEGSSTTAPASLELNQVTSSVIETAGEQDQFEFTLSSSRLMYLDALTDNADFHWTLTDSSGIVVNQRSFTASNAAGVSDADAVLNLTAGTYTLTIDASPGATGAYAFRVMDFQTTTVALTSGVAVSDRLTFGSQTHLYSLSASAGQRLHFQPLAWSGSDQARWRLIDDTGSVVASQMLNKGGVGVELNSGGTYWILVEGDAASTTLVDDFEFRVDLETVSASHVLQPGTPTAGNITSAGDLAEYTFTASAGDQIVVDFASADTTDHFLRLRNSQGDVDAEVSFVAGTAADQVTVVTVTESGRYHLVAGAANGQTGSYGFQLSLRSDDHVGGDASGTLDSVSGREIHRFQGLAGQTVQLKLDPWGGASDLASSARRLSTDGGTEDGYSAIDAALQLLQFREGASKHIVLITDEDRDNAQGDIETSSDISASIAYRDQLIAQTQADDITVHSILNLQIDSTDQTDNALGIDGRAIDSNAFFADGNGGYTTEMSNGVTFDRYGSGNDFDYTSNVRTEADYVDLALDVDGTVWDLHQLRDGGATGTSFALALSFSQAFVDIITNSVRDDFDYDLISTDPNVQFEVLDYRRLEDSVSFDIRWTGDGQGHGFDLQFARAENHAVVKGSIPVQLTTHYVRLTEDSDFHTFSAAPVTIQSDTQAVSFRFSDLSFDSLDTDGINDAFELALLDTAGNSLVATTLDGHDAFFNWTEGEGVALGGGAIYDSATGTVTVDVTHVAAETQAILTARLVNNDGDTTTTVAVDPVAIRLISSPVASPVTTTPPRPGNSPQGADFSVLDDITSQIGIDYRQTFYSEADDVMSSEFDLTHQGTDVIRGPVLVEVRNISDASVTIVNPDGTTPAGNAYYDVSHLFFAQPTDTLTNGDVISGGALRFSNPNEVQFNYELVFHGHVFAPRSATITGPATVSEGATYTLTLNSSDPDNDAVQSWTVNWGDGNVVTYTGDPGTVTHVYADGDAAHTISAFATDEDGEAHAVDLPITVLNVAPVLTLNGDPTVNEGAVYTLSLGAFDPGADTISSWTVHWGDDTSDTYTGNLSPVTHTYTDGPETHTITAEVTDEDGSYVTTSITVDVLNVAPVPTISGAPSVLIGQTYTLDLSTTTDPGEDTIDYWDIDWGDGSGVQRYTGNPTSVTHVYHSTGPVTVLASVTDDDGTWDAVPQQIDVRGVTLIEGTSFLVDHVYQFSVPEQPGSVTISYANLIFDHTDSSRINDAVEVALLDMEGMPVADTIVVGRDAAINLTEGETELVGGMASADLVSATDGSVSIDLTHLAAGTAVQLVVRLVNNDTDEQTRVTIDPVLSFDQGPVSDASTVTTPGYSGDPRSVDFNHLTDISHAVDVDYGHTSFHDENNVLMAGVSLTNTGSFSLTGSLLVAVRGISDPSVTVAHADGFTPDGLSYFDVSHLFFADSTTALNPGDSITGFDLSFHNPNEIQFDYELVFLGHINQAPIYDPVSDIEIHADNPLTVATSAIDPDGDPVTYSVVSGPTEVVVDPHSGVLTWNPTASDVGLHQVHLRATDPFGLSHDQIVTIHVYQGVPNRTPYFVSTPIVDAFAGVPYQYDADAVDPDSDPLTYSVVSVSVDNQPGYPVTDFEINPLTGQINWTPTGALHNQTVSVVIQADDGRGGIVQQPWKIVVHPNPLNTPPVIVSTPDTYFLLPDPVFGSSSGDVAPDSVFLRLEDGESSDETLSLTFESDTPLTTSDIVFVVDEYSSMAAEHAWLEQVILDLDAQLVAAGSGNNRYSLVGYAGAASPGGRILPVNGSNWGTAAEVAQQTNSLTASGTGTQEGFGGINYAIDNLTFRSQVASHVVLITDRSQGYANPAVTESVLHQALSDGGHRLHTLVPSEILNRGESVLGISGFGLDETKDISIGEFSELPAGTGSLHVSTYRTRGSLAEPFARPVDPTAWFDEHSEFVYTPETDFVGTTTFDYTVTSADGHQSSETVTINVVDVVSAEDARPLDDHVVMGMDRTVAIDFLDNDLNVPEPDPDIGEGGNGANQMSELITFTQPAEGTVTFLDEYDVHDVPPWATTSFPEYEVAPRFLYTPPEGFTGTTSFTYELYEGTHVATVNINVVDDEQPALSVFAETIEVAKNQSISIDVLSNDYLRDGGTHQGGEAYTEAVGGGYESEDAFHVRVRDENGTTLDIRDDYVELPTVLQGTSWDLPQLLGGTGATQAFVDVLSDQIAADALASLTIDVDLQMSDPSVDYQILETHVTQTGATVDVRFFGDGISHDFDIDLVRTDLPGQVLGTIPALLLANTTYYYDVDAVDLEGDTITYSLTSATVDGQPDYDISGVTIDSETGLLAWKPPLDLAGETVTLTVTADDGNGGADHQTWKLILDADPHNNPPEIISTADTQFTLPDFTSGTAIGEVTPDALALHLAPGESTVEQLSISPDPADPFGTADIVFVVDESGSMYSEHAWLAQMVLDMDQALEQAGISQNRYSLIGYGGGSQTSGRLLTTGGWGTADEVSYDTSTLVTDGGFEDGYRAIDIALQSLTFRNDASTHIVLITDEDRDVGDATVTKESLQSALSQAGHSLHTIVSTGLSLGGRDVLGNRGYVDGAEISLGQFTQPEVGTVTHQPADGGYVYGGWSFALLETDESLVYTPPQDFVGETSFSYTVVDHDGNEDSATVQVTVVDAAPTATLALDDSAIVAAGTSTIIDVTANDYFASSFPAPSNSYEPGDDVGPQPVVTSQPDYGTVTVLPSYAFRSEGSSVNKAVHARFEFTPDVGFTGQTSFTYSVEDAAGQVTSATVDVTVVPVGDVTVGATGEHVIVFKNQSIAVPVLVNDYVIAADGHSTFLEAPNGEFLELTGTEYSTVPGLEIDWASGTTIEDYLELSDSLGGTNWNLQQLRAGEQRALSFTRAFVDQITELTVADLDLDIRLTDSSLDYEVLRRHVTADGITFDVRITGDGQAHSFDAEFFRHSDPGIVAGAIPITMQNLYHYDTEAIDIDGDPIRYDLVGETHGASFDNATGELLWDPQGPGQYTFTVKASDHRGGEDTRTWTVNVVTSSGNNVAPVITPVAPQTLSRGVNFSLDLQATDADGDQLTWQLIDDPTQGVPLPYGVTIDPWTGHLNWTPGSLQLGQHTIRVRVVDGQGGQATTDLSLTVEEPVLEQFNRPPTITSQPPQTVVFGENYHYQLTVDDPDHDAVTFTMTLGPDRAGIPEYSGHLIWTPQQQDIGVHTFSIKASDGRGGTDTQFFQVTVLDRNLSPEFQSSPENAAGSDTLWTYDADAWDPNGDVLTYELDDASLARGMTIDSATGLISWTPDSTGEFQVTVRAEDQRGGWATQQFVLSVGTNAPPVFLSQPDGDVFVGEEFTYPIQVSDPDAGPGDTITLTLDSDSLSRNMVIDAGNVLRWTPDVAGDYTVTITADDGNGGTALQQFVLPARPRVVASLPPEITSVPVGPAWVGDTWEYRITATDADSDDTLLTYQLMSPGGDPQVTFDGSQTVSWSPLTVGDQTFTVRVTDDSGSWTEQQFTVPAEMPVANDPPEITSIPTGPARLDQQYRYQVEAHDPNGDSLTYSVDGTSYALGVDIDPVSGLLTWTPGTTGTIQISVHVDDPSGLRATQTFHLPVVDPTVVTPPDPANVPPQITSIPTGPAWVGLEWEYFLTAVDVDDSVAALVYSLESPSVGSGVSFDASTGRLAWTPSSSGEQTFVLKVTDSAGNQAEQSFVVPALSTPPVNQAPVIRSIPPSSARVGNVYRYNIDAWDPNGDDLTWSLDSDSAAAGFHISDDGELTWQPPIAGDQPVSVTVSDGSLQTTQSWLLTVLPPVTTNTPPSIVSQPTGPAVRDLSWQYQAVASDPDGDVLSWSLDTSAIPDSALSDLSIDSDGLVTWTPVVHGTYTMTVLVSDPSGAGEQQTFSLTVLENAPPRITSSPVTSVDVTQPYAYNVTAVDPNPEDAPLLTFSLDQASLDRGLTIDAATGVISWTPTSAGISPVTVTVTDPEGAVDQQTFDLQVIDNTPGSNNAPVIHSQIREQITVGWRLLHQLDATDVDGDPLSWTLLTPPAGMTMDETGLIDWTPSASQVGQQFGFTVQVDDGRVAVPVEKSFTIEVVSEPTNTPPDFVSTPSTSLIINSAWKYDAQAIDPEGDTLFYSLVEAPSQATINSRTGEITWTPGVDDLGEHSLTIRAIDTLGASATQSTTLTVRSINRPPTLIATPPTVAVLGELYGYQFTAEDPDGHTVVYSLGAATTDTRDPAIDPDAPTIDPNTGTFAWVPDALGVQTIQVNVVDEFGMGIAFGYNVNVVAAAPNQPPVIHSTPGLQAPVGETYTYDVNATDPDPGDTITYNLVQPSTLLSGMTWDSTTGLLTWDPDPALVGQLVSFQVQATDGDAVYTQIFGVVVTPANVAPSITPIDDQILVAGTTLTVGVNAVDSNGDALSYTLDAASTAAGLQIDQQTGVITWHTDSSSVTTTPLTATVTVSDGRLSTTDSFDITVDPDNTGPEVTITLDRATANIGDTVSILVTAVDDVAVSSRSLTLLSVDLAGNVTVLNEGLALDTFGRARLTLTEAHQGILTFAASARDHLNTLGHADNVSLPVYNPADTLPPDVSITVPTDGTPVTDVTSVLGSVSDEGDLSLLDWTLSLTSDSGTVTEIGAGTGAVDNAFLGNIDPTLLKNGVYRLTLSATDEGNNTATDSISVEIESQLKLGAFALSFVDLEVPVVGIPITVTRSYNTLNTDTQGDFGYGWTLDMSNTEVQVTAAEGSDPGLFGYTPFVNGTRVVITLPDGSTEGFTFHGQPGTVFGSGVFDYVPTFIPDYGVTSELIVAGGPFRKEVATGEYYDLESGRTFSPEDPYFGGSYVLRLRNGTELVINAETGNLSSVVDTNGNEVTFTGMGIQHSAGRGIQFERDFAGRITRITDPAGQAIHYSYDPDGNLTSVTDRSGATTQFTYLDHQGAPEHYLDEIIDAFGRPAARTTYDDSGRIASVIDSAGHTIEYTYDIAGKSQTITDQLGNVSHVFFDQRGNVIREVDPLGGTITRTFDENDNLLTESTVIGQIDSPENGESDDITITSVYNEDGDLLQSIDARGNVTHTTYNELGQQTSTTDALGNTSRIFYDSRGLPGATIDPLGNPTSFSFDSKGNLTSVTDDDGNVLVTNTHNNFGDVTSSTSVTGRTTYFDYDINGNQVASWYFEGSGPDEVQVLSLTRYDAENRVIGSTHAVLPQGQFRTSTLTNAVIASEFVTSSSATQYNLAGQVESTTDTYGFVTQNVYDLRGQLVETRRQTLDESGATVWLLSRTAWDELGRAIASTSTFVEGSAEPVTGTLSTYDAAGRAILSQQVTDLLIAVTGPDNSLQATILRTGTVTSSSATSYTAAGRMTSSTDSYGLQTQTTYNAYGEVTQTRRESRQEDGASVWFTTRTVYDEYGRVAFATDRMLEGATAPTYGTQTVYDDLGRVVQSVRRLGVQVAIDAAGNSSLTASGTVVYQTETRYDSDGRSAITIDSYGLESRTIYDELGRVTESRRQSVNEAGTVVWLVSRTVYDSLGRVDISTDTVIDGSSSTVYGNRTVYDDQGRAVKSVRLQGVDISIDVVTGNASWNTAGTELWSTETIYNQDGTVHQTIGADGQTTEYEYDSSGRQVAMIGTPVEIDGVIVRLRSETVYDALGRATEQKTNIAQRADGTLDRSGEQITRHEFDFRGNLVKTTFDDGTFVEMTYDERGRKLTETNQLGLTRTHAYDSQGRLASVTLPDLDGDPATTGDIATYNYAYDAFGNQTLLTDPLGRDTRWTFDEYGRETSRTLPLGFGADGVQGTADDLFGEDGISGTADDLPPLPPGEGWDEGRYTELRAYDARGRMARHTSFEGVITEYIYDDHPSVDSSITSTGRLLEKRFYDDAAAWDNGNGIPSETWSYTYDAFGRELTATMTVNTTSLTTTNTYNALGQLIAVSSPTGVLRYAYDNLGRRTEVAVLNAGDDPFVAPPQRTTAYTYDSLGRLATVVEDRDSSSTTDDLSTTYYYDLLGNLDRMLAPNDILTDYTYDSLNRLDRMTDYRTDGSAADLADLSDNTVVADYDYTVRDDGKRTGLSETFENGISTDYTWTYDNLGRVTREEVDSSNDFDQTTEFQYDLTGNRTQVTRDLGNDGSIDETTTSTFDANDRLQTETTGGKTTSYSYDHTQQTGKTVTNADATSVETAFTYDLQGRMHTATITTKDAVGTTTRIERTTYDYDSKGIRFQAVQQIDSDPVVSPGWNQVKQTDFLVDHHNHTGYQQVLRETEYVDGVKTQTVDYSFGHDEITQTTTGYNPDGSPQPAETLVFGHDGHGNVRVLTDMAAAIVQLFVYDAYGQMLAIFNGAGAVVSGSTGVYTDPSAALTSTLYSGEQFDTRIGQQYLRARYYDPASGRFNRLDPFFGRHSDPQSFHKYLYTHADPVNGIDPTGLMEFSIAGFKAAIATGMSNTVAFTTAVWQAGFWGKLTVIAAIAGGSYLSLIQFGNFSRLSRYTTTVNLYVAPLSGPQMRDPDFTFYRQSILEHAASVERRLNDISEKTTYNIIDGALPTGVEKGYDWNSHTLNLIVEWSDAEKGPLAQGIHHKLSARPLVFENKLQEAMDNGRLHVPVNATTKSQYLANLVLHETAHLILERASFRQWMGLRDHTADGLMGGLPYGSNIPFNEASLELFDFDEGTKAEIRVALGEQWGWY